VLRVELIGHLKAAAGGEVVEVSLSGEEELLTVLKKLPEKVRELVINRETGGLATGLLVLVNGAEVKRDRIRDVRVRDGDTVSLIPAIHGGAGDTIHD